MLCAAPRCRGLRLGWAWGAVSRFCSSAANRQRPMSMADFDPTVFECYYNRAEPFPDINLKQKWTRSSLLTRVQQLLSSYPPLLARQLRPSWGQEEGAPTPEGALKEACNIRVMQWNVLSQGLCLGRDNFVRCPKEALQWSLRRLRMLEEILLYDPDVMCLQEVDHFGFLCPILGAIGYDGAFCPKPDSPALYVEDSNGPDGCCVFYKLNKFEFVDKDTVVLKADNAFTNQVSVVFTLRPRALCSSSSVQQLCIATTHLKAKYGWEELRHKQGSFLLDYLEKKVSRSDALLVCGDLNADCIEPVYNAFVQSSLKLSSAYKNLSPDGATEPNYTTWKIRGGSGPDGGEQHVCRTLDYIWYTDHALRLKALLNFPTDEQIGQDRLPSFRYPSDHFSLVAEFALLKADDSAADK